MTCRGQRGGESQLELKHHRFTVDCVWIWTDNEPAGVQTQTTASVSCFLFPVSPTFLFIVNVKQLHLHLSESFSLHFTFSLPFCQTLHLKMMYSNTVVLKVGGAAPREVQRSGGKIQLFFSSFKLASVLNNVMVRLSSFRWSLNTPDVTPV